MILLVDHRLALWHVFLFQLEKKRQAKANTQAQLAALEAQAAGLVAAKGKNEVEAARLGSVASDVKATTTMLERAVAKSLLSQEKVDSAVAATIQQTARLEAKVKALEEEKERVLRKITNYEEASQAFCFNFSAMFDVPSADMPSAATRMPPKQPSTTEVNECL
jgi:chromosome segregation ATPase